MARPPREPVTANFVALGCAKNLIDSEKMLGLLVENGVGLVGPDEPADVTIINTCGFIEDARSEALENIRAAEAAKQAGQVRAVLVVGCLAQLWGKKLQDQAPGIDAVVGLSDRHRVAEIVVELAAAARARTALAAPPPIVPFRSPADDDRARLRLTDASWAYLRISEGCGQGCTFCAIPTIRGPFRSKDPALVIAEAQELSRDGALELNLIAQETTGYGRDLEGGWSLSRLLRDLDHLDETNWLRVLYAHPATVTDDLIAALAQCPKVVPYLDVPLQHINDRVLRAMNRHLDRAGTESVLQRLRAGVPDVTLRTTVLVGFPGETDAEFEELLAFVRAFRFEALGCFAYSAEPQTAAAQLGPAVPDAVKAERAERIMLAQRDIAFAQADALVGVCRRCLVTGPLEDEEVAGLELDPAASWYRGRHAGQAPEIDGECFLRGPAPEAGFVDGFVAVRFTGRSDYDLLGIIESIE